MFNKFGRLALAAGLTVFVLPTVSWADPADPGNHNPITASIAWMQTAAEYKALCHQTYNTARLVIDEKVRTGAYVKVGDKLCEQTFYTLDDGKVVRFYRPLAIVLDIDETILDNSGAEAWLIRNKVSHNNENWSAWCFYQGSHPEICREVPGASEFLKHCMEIGVTPIYLTDRDESVREPTLRTLEALGLGCPDLNDHLILQDRKRDIANAKKLLADMNLDESSDLGKYMLNNYSGKAGRRMEILKTYKVLGWFGDNMYDMPVNISKDLKGPSEVIKARDKEIEDHKNDLGATFFMLPNATYGSWLKTGVTVSNDDMAEFTSDYGFGKWYEAHKAELHGGSTR